MNSIRFCIFFLIENNLMGAAEWTGYTNSSPTYPTPTYSALPPPGPAPPSAASYGYDIANMDHPSNFHIPTSKYWASQMTYTAHTHTHSTQNQFPLFSPQLFQLWPKCNRIVPLNIIHRIILHRPWMYRLWYLHHRRLAIAQATRCPQIRAVCRNLHPKSIPAMPRPTTIGPMATTIISMRHVQRPHHNLSTRPMRQQRPQPCSFIHKSIRRSIKIKSICTCMAPTKSNSIWIPAKMRWPLAMQRAMRVLAEASILASAPATIQMW